MTWHGNWQGTFRFITGNAVWQLCITFALKEKYFFPTECCPKKGFLYLKGFRYLQVKSNNSCLTETLINRALKSNLHLSLICGCWLFASLHTSVNLGSIFLFGYFSFFLCLVCAKFSVLIKMSTKLMQTFTSMSRLNANSVLVLRCSAFQRRLNMGIPFGCCLIKL